MGLDFSVDISSISSSTIRDDGIFLSDLIRIPQLNDGHILEIVSLPENTKVGFGIGDNFTEISEEKIFQIYTNENPDIITAYRFSSADIENASIKISKDVANGTDALAFKARVGVLDGVMDSGEERLAYSRFSDFTITLGTVHGIENNLILDGDDENITAGSGNDIIVADLDSSGSINGGDGEDALVLTNSVNGNSKAIVDLNKGELYLVGSVASEGITAVNTRVVESIETVVGTPGDDTIVGNASNTEKVTLIGAGGDDYLVGGAGSDMLIGGVGDDILSGGQGADQFVIAVSDNDGNRDAGTDRIINFDLTDKITFTGFELLKSEDGSLPTEVNVVKNGSTDFYEISVQKSSGGNMLKAFVIIEDTSNLSSDQAIAITAN